jgi:hypothetical protein
MSKPACEWAIFYDPLHILSVWYSRQEVRLYENGGSSEGKVLFKRDEPVAKVSIADPFELLNLAFHFVISYDLLAQIADEKALAYFEQIGAREFLERMAAVTPEQERRHRLNGLGPKLTTFVKEKPQAERGRKRAQPATSPSEATATA